MRRHRFGAIRAALVAVALVAACSSAQPSGTIAPGQATNAAPAQSEPGQAPIGTDAPLGPGEVEITDALLNPPPEALPEPLLDTTDEIVEALFNPADPAQAIVSMLRALGIGTYRDDGSPIRPGNETSEADFFLFESEVRGLVNMLLAQSDGETWITFRDFHAELVELGLEATAEQLLQLYAETYAELPDTPMTRFVQAQAFLDLEGQIPPLGVWLLFLDGMVPPNAASGQLASTGGGMPIALQSGPTFGQLTQRLQQRFNSPQVQRNINAARARAALSSAAIRSSAASTSVHKGHGGPGDSTSVTVEVNAFQYSSPFGGRPMQPCSGGNLSGIPVRWTYEGLEEHATPDVANGATSSTDGTGRTTMRFTTMSEENQAWLRGVQTSDLAWIEPMVNAADVARALCPGVLPGNIRGPVISGLARAIQAVRIDHHVPRAMLVVLTNTYDVEFPSNSQLGGNASMTGVDTFVGRMAEKPDGTWKGFLVGHTGGSGTGLYRGVGDCPSSWGAFQVLEVFGESRPGRLPRDRALTTNGNFVFDFYPASPSVVQAGTRSCPAASHPGSRYAWAPFFSSYVWSGIGLGIKLPADPGGFEIYPELSDVPTVILKPTTGWTVDITFCSPNRTPHCSRPP